MPIKYSELRTNYNELKECYDIVLRTARRVTRDLRHAIDQIPADNEFRQMTVERYDKFYTILADVREYRLELHNEIDRLTYQVKEHERLLAARAKTIEEDTPLFDSTEEPSVEEQLKEDFDCP